MPTVYKDPVFSEPPPAFPTTGVHTIRVRHTTQAAYAAGDSIKIAQLPKGASILPNLCMIFSDDASDPGNGAMTVTLKVTDGTTTKTIIPATALGGVGVLITPVIAEIAALKFFKTSNNDFYVLSEIGANPAFAGAYIYYVIAYTMDGGRSEVTT